MPFLSPDHRPLIKHPIGHPVSVRASFNTLGDFIPKSFCIEDDNSERFKYQVDAILTTKDLYMIKIFYCSYIAYGCRNNIVLTFDIVKHYWAVG